MRRPTLLILFLSGVSIFISPQIVAGQHPTPPPPQPRQSPNAPSNQNAPMGLDQPPSSTQSDNARENPQKDKEIRDSVHRLFELASDLRNDVDKTNSNMVLSVSLVKRANEIEKLAKQIREHAKQ